MAERFATFGSFVAIAREDPPEVVLGRRHRGPRRHIGCGSRRRRPGRVALVHPQSDPHRRKTGDRRHARRDAHGACGASGIEMPGWNQATIYLTHYQEGRSSTEILADGHHHGAWIEWRPHQGEPPLRGRPTATQVGHLLSSADVIRGTAPRRHRLTASWMTPTRSRCSLRSSERDGSGRLDLPAPPRPTTRPFSRRSTL